MGIVAIRPHISGNVKSAIRESRIKLVQKIFRSTDRLLRHGPQACQDLIQVGVVFQNGELGARARQIVGHGQTF